MKSSPSIRRGPVPLPPIARSYAEIDLDAFQFEPLNQAQPNGAQPPAAAPAPPAPKNRSLRNDSLMSLSPEDEESAGFVDVGTHDRAALVQPGLFSRLHKLNSGQWHRILAKDAQNHYSSSVFHSYGELATAIQDFFVIQKKAAPGSCTRAQFFDGRSIFGVPTILPTVKWYWWWAWVILLLDATYSAFVVPIEVAWVNSPVLWARIIDGIAGGLIIVDIVFNFHVGFVAKHGLAVKLVMDGKLIAWRYLRSWNLFIDVVSLTPMIWSFLAYAGPTKKGPLQLLRMLRLLRFVAVSRRIIKSFLGGATIDRQVVLRGAVSPIKAYAIQLIYFTLFVINLIGSMWFWVANLEGYSDSWLVDASVGPADDAESLVAAGPVTQWVASCYFALTTIATVGYGDILPVTTAERLVVMIIQLVGIVFFGLLVGSLSEIIRSSNMGASHSEERRRERAEVDHFMRKHRIGQDVKDRTQLFFEQLWAVRDNHQTALRLFNELPEHLWADIALSLVGSQLRAMDSFRGLPEGVVRMVAGKLEPRWVAPGQELAREGEPNDRLFLLRDGVIFVLVGEAPVGEVKGPAVLCQLSLLSLVEAVDGVGGLRRKRGFRAKSSCLVFMLHIDSLAPLLLGRPKVFALLLQAIETHLRASLARSPSMTREVHRIVEMFERTSARVLERAREADEEAAELEGVREAEEGGLRGSGEEYERAISGVLGEAGAGEGNSGKEDGAAHQTNGRQTPPSARLSSFSSGSGEVRVGQVGAAGGDAEVVDDRPAGLEEEERKER